MDLWFFLALVCWACGFAVFVRTNRPSAAESGLASASPEPQFAAALLVVALVALGALFALFGFADWLAHLAVHAVSGPPGAD